MRMVNERPWADVLSDLQEDFPTEKRDSGSVYVKVDEIEKRVFEVLSPGNYDWVISDIQILNIGSNYSISLRGTLTVKDDEGCVITTRTCPGGSDITFQRESPDRVSVEIKSSVAAAASNAFVKCWQSMGVANQVDFRSRKKSSSTPSASISSGESRWYNVRFDSNFTVNVEKMTATADVRVDEKVVELTILKSGIRWLAETFQLSEADVLKCLQTQYGVEQQRPINDAYIFGDMQVYRNKEQLLFKEGFVKKGGS